MKSSECLKLDCPTCRDCACAQCVQYNEIMLRNLNFWVLRELMKPFEEVFTDKVQKQDTSSLIKDKEKCT